jgi:hypothetical protein
MLVLMYRSCGCVLTDVLVTGLFTVNCHLLNCDFVLAGFMLKN